MPEPTDQKAAAIARQLGSLKTEAAQIEKRRERDAARLVVIQMQIDALEKSGGAEG